MVWRIRIVLCFQAKAGAMGIELATFAAHCAIQEVSAVKLDARFCGQHFQDSPTGWFEHLGCNLQAIGSSLF
jgi:hypothetical protein